VSRPSSEQVREAGRRWAAHRATLALALTACALLAGRAAAEPAPPAKSPPPAAAAPTAPAPSAAASGEAASASCPATNLIVSSSVRSGTSTGGILRTKDGMLALEGALWNSPEAAILTDTSSHLTYDLGGERELRGLVVQGDNNDAYFVETSLDGAKFEQVWIAPITEIGQGLRTRAHVLAKPVRARFLRIRPRNGDNFYSISEVQAYCKLPKVFPPPLRIPPVKFGWDAIDNDRMVWIKGVIASIAALVMCGFCFRVTRERRITSVGARVAFIGVLSLLTLAALCMGYVALQGEKLVARVRGSTAGWFYSAGVLGMCALAVLALCWKRGGPRVVDSLLAIIGVLSFTGWWNFGHYHFDHYIHIWEHYHYIIGAKYAPELRYARLYQCTAVADMQDGLRTRVKERKMRRIENDNELGTTAEIMAHPELCLSHFEPARWEQFKKDIRFFRGRFSRERWDQSQQDHGYNGTPVWGIVARYLGDHTELTWDNIVRLGMIDSGFLIAMWLAVLWAFGWRPACVALVYWGMNFPARFYWNGGSFLRYDWILWMVLGLCFLRKDRMVLGGAALTYATLLRVSPGFIVATLVLKALYGMIVERRFFVTRPHQYFAAGCVAALLVLIPASRWSAGGLDAWPEFAQNSKKHLATALTNNMGFKTVLGYELNTRAKQMRNDTLEDPFGDWKDAKQHFYRARAPLQYLLLLMFCYMLARAAHREEVDWAAACLGCGLIIMSAELTCYYWGFLLPFGLVWQRRKLPGILAAALAASTCFIYFALDWNDDHFAAMSLAAVLTVVAITAQAAFGQRASTEPDAG
jgi:hypothetical protein